MSPSSTPKSGHGKHYERNQKRKERKRQQKQQGTSFEVVLPRGNTPREERSRIRNISKNQPPDALGHTSIMGQYASKVANFLPPTASSEDELAGSTPNNQTYETDHENLRHRNHDEHNSNSAQRLPGLNNPQMSERLEVAEGELMRLVQVRSKEEAEHKEIVRKLEASEKISVVTESELESRKAEIAALKRKLAIKFTNADKIDKMKRKLHEMQGLEERSQRKITKLERDVNKLEDERDIARQNLEASIIQQQEQAFQNIRSAKWTFRDEGAVKSESEELQRAMKSAARDVAGDWPVPMDESKKELYSELLRTCGSVLNYDARIDPLAGMSERKKPVVVLNALLAHTIYTKIIVHPFGFLGPATGKALQDVSELAIFGNNEKEAHSWRADALRMLLPQLDSESTSSQITLHHTTNQKIVDTARSIGQKFIDGPVSLLLRPDCDAADLESLISLFEQAGHLAYELWARKTNISCVTLDRIHPECRFDLESGQMTAHALVKKPDTLQGQTFMLMVHPLLMVYGTESGKNYSRGRVWIPAEVWLPNEILMKREVMQID